MGEKYCGDYLYLLGSSHISTNWWGLRYCFWVNWNTNDHISTNIQPKKYIKGSMGQWHLQSKKAVVILHIYWAESIFLLFYDDQDT